MLQQIRDALETASDTDVESIYWMVMLELGEGWKEVIYISNPRQRGGMRVAINRDPGYPVKYIR